ncbi:hypothetical protein [Bradyrhizobium sp.]|uniref:hypothetical protein n=1 Tax=Bradyrhizobium sp. TaxID=376 RepID=UPI001D7735B1|nr:hypothetical protein [Bradyrhizobium sp.]MBV8701102.1 hypothetical protein [Bradyrhizobium sp.]MBV8917866.1 hypothetical protein [Bradyrhizobium sp.]
MAHAYWFKPKKYGYGAAPNTWEGWAVTAAYCLVVWASAAILATHTGSRAMLVGMASIIVAATIALVVIAVWKTDGHWGRNAVARQDSGKND